MPKTSTEAESAPGRAQANMKYDEPAYRQTGIGTEYCRSSAWARGANISIDLSRLISEIGDLSRLISEIG